MELRIEQPTMHTLLLWNMQVIEPAAHIFTFAVRIVISHYGAYFGRLQVMPDNASVYTSATRHGSLQLALIPSGQGLD